MYWIHNKTTQAYHVQQVLNDRWENLVSFDSFWKQNPFFEQERKNGLSMIAFFSAEHKSFILQFEGNKLNHISGKELQTQSRQT